MLDREKVIRENEWLKKLKKLRRKQRSKPNSKNEGIKMDKETLNITKGKEHPTREQIKEFWGEQGFVEIIGTKEWWQYEKYKETNHWWEAPNGRRYQEIPEIDLNNLFRYAPITDESELLISFHEVHWTNGKVFTECVINKDYNEIGRGVTEGKLKDVAYLALFWAVHKAWEDKNESKD